MEMLMVGLGSGRGPCNLPQLHRETGVAGNNGSSRSRFVAVPPSCCIGRQTRTNRCPGRRLTSRLSSRTLSVAMTWPAVMPVRAIRSSTAVG